MDLYEYLELKGEGAREAESIRMEQMERRQFDMVQFANGLLQDHADSTKKEVE
ncbi:MAG: hypothetical protein M0R80_26130 [Proteobacteria bacterium]|jgi:hypothetical protein|nr:hypothetical protein [Pseudomonadota bacterium]